MAGDVIAPYAQAAAVANKDGTVARSKGVVEIKRTGLPTAWPASAWAHR